MSDIQRLAAMLAQSKDTLVLTEPECLPRADPDFRSPGTGLWSTMDPMELFPAQSWSAIPGSSGSGQSRFFANGGPSPIAPTMPWQNWKRQV